MIDEEIQRLERKIAELEEKLRPFERIDISRGHVERAGDNIYFDLGEEPEQVVGGGGGGESTRMMLVGEPDDPGGVNEIRDAIVDAYIGSGTVEEPEFSPRIGDVLYGFWAEDRVYRLMPRQNVAGVSVTTVAAGQQRFDVTFGELSYTAQMILRNQRPTMLSGSLIIGSGLFPSRSDLQQSLVDNVFTGSGPETRPRHGEVVALMRNAEPAYLYRILETNLPGSGGTSFRGLPFTTHGREWFAAGWEGGLYI